MARNGNVIRSSTEMGALDIIDYFREEMKFLLTDGIPPPRDWGQGAVPRPIL